MSDASEKYEFFASGEHRAPHWLRAYLPAWSPKLDCDETMQKLAALMPEAARAQRIDPQDGESWRVRCGDFEFALDESESPSNIHFQGRGLSEADIEAIEGSHHTLILETRLGENVLEDFHATLRYVDAMAPETVALHDVAACTFWPGTWLRSSAAASVPPPPSSLFTVHAVADPDDPSAWLHSHGLMRCGSIELELLDVPREHSGLMCSTLLNVAAAMFIEQGVPPPGDPFLVGQDLDLVWLPWEEALTKVSDKLGGGWEDRDDDHNLASGVLFAPAVKRLGLFRGRERNPSVHLELLQGNPLLYHSAMETRRMSMLAKETFPTLRRLVERFGSDEDWGFLAKLGYTVDDGENSEHLWFEVHAIANGQIEGTLLNQPYAVSRLSEGDRGWHPPDLLSDWMVNTPHGQFGPSSVGELLAKLDEA